MNNCWTNLKDKRYIFKNIYNGNQEVGTYMMQNTN